MTRLIHELGLVFIRRESENQELYNENQGLREKIEVLEYLVGTGDPIAAGGSEDPFSYIDGKSMGILGEVIALKNLRHLKTMGNMKIAEM